MSEVPVQGHLAHKNGTLLIKTFPPYDPIVGSCLGPCGDSKGGGVLVSEYPYRLTCRGPSGTSERERDSGRERESARARETERAIYIYIERERERESRLMPARPP